MTLTTYFVLALTLFVSAHASGGWSYTEPSKWGKDYPACDGKSQSPINVITGAAKYDSSIGKFKLTGYDTMAAHGIVNNGHTIQLNIDYTTSATGGGLPGTYKALQLHFHWSANNTGKGSEHVMNGKAYPLEVHIVHMNTAYGSVTEALSKSDGLAVLGFFFEIGDKNAAMDKFLSDIPAIKASGAKSGSLSIAELLGGLDGLENFYRYAGSLTTPPCSEAVVWTLFEKKLTISQAQLQVLWKVADSHGDQYGNYRPLQMLNGRTIYTTIHSSGMKSTAISVLVFFSAVLSANLF